jgi:hypothetical protein
VAKYAIVVMSEHSEGNPGGQARLLHALSAARDLVQAQKSHAPAMLSRTLSNSDV